MISVYNYLKYRDFISDRFKDMPNHGRGQSRKLSLFLGVHTTLVSQVLKGHKTFTLEQASLTADFLELPEPEAEFFMLLVQLDRAGNPSLRRRTESQIAKLKRSSQELVNRLPTEKRISEAAKSIFYSDWIYLAAMQLTAINNMNTLDSISNALNVNRKRMAEVLKFLIDNKFCVELNGKIQIGMQNIHLESTSRWIKMHHTHWRHQALNHLNDEDANQVHYSGPMTLSEMDASQIREMIVQFLVQVGQVVSPSKSERLYCLNIDWFPLAKFRDEG